LLRSTAALDDCLPRAGRAERAPVRRFDRRTILAVAVK